MELNNDFEVDRPIEEAWVVLTDVERIAPCLPGAQLEEIEGDEYRGSVKVKVGPITAQYKGKATFIEKDDVAHRAVLKAEGRDSRGQGNANAMITAQLVSIGANRTKVSVSTDLTVTGKVAQFGRGVMADVSEKLLGQFVDNLETKVLSQPSASNPAASAPAGASAESAAGFAVVAGVAGVAAVAPTVEAATNGAATPPTVRKVTQSEPVEPVDLLEASGASVAKRVVPVIAAIFVLWVLSRLRRGGAD